MLRVFEGIDVAAVIPIIKMTIIRRCELPRRHSQSDNSPKMSMHAVSFFVEVIFLKVKSLQALRRYTCISFKLPFYTSHSAHVLSFHFPKTAWNQNMHYMCCWEISIYYSLCGEVI